MLNEEQKQVLKCIDEEFIVKFAMGLTNIHSPTGLEREASEFVYKKMLSMGLRARLQSLSDTRANALGELPGSGGGHTLMFNGHMDISYSEREVYLPGGDNTYFKPSFGVTGFSLEPSVLENGWIKGNGIRNMKNAMAAYLGAVDAIMKSGIKLKGDIVIAAVAGEIEKDCVDDFQGHLYLGHGVGTTYLVTHGGIADMCICGEPSFSEVSQSIEIKREIMGCVWAKISIRGDYAHTAWCDRVVNPIFRMNKLIQVIRTWISDYQNRNVYHGSKPAVNIGAIQGGWPWRLARTPGYCSIYLDVRFTPEQKIMDVKEELNNLIREFQSSDPEMDIEFELVATHQPSVVGEDELLIKALKAAHQNIMNKPPIECISSGVGDAPILNNYGIPTCYYGPGGRNRPGGKEYCYGWQSVEDLMECTRVYALSAIDICSRDKRRLK